MNQRQREVEKNKLTQEKEVINRLQRQYNSAEKQIAEHIKKLQEQIKDLTDKMLKADPKEVLIIKSQIMAKVYQKDYQENLKKQIDKSMDVMNNAKNRTVHEYLKECYTTGYVGSMYGIHGQGIPVISPINVKDVERALTLNAKVSDRLYRGYTAVLKKQIQSEISRGLLQALPYADMARSLHGVTNASFNNTMRIVRTEGHRIQIQSAMDACHEAKKQGADIVKQWDATLDGDTRESHRQLDGQIVEIDKDFQYAGGSVSAPGMFGDPAEDCNCRCALLQRAKWALGEDELETLKERAEYFGLDKTNEFEDFKSRYISITGNKDIVKTISSGIIKNITIDDFRVAALGSDISDDILEVINANCKDKGMLFHDVVIEKISNVSKEKVLLQTEPYFGGRRTLTRLKINETVFKGRSLKEINEQIKQSKNIVANNLQEAVWHENGHAKIYYNKSFSEIEKINKELEKIHYDGFSITARKDGSELIAEIEVLLKRGEDIPDEAIEIYNKYVGG